jgi:hypothetical protein
MALRQTFIHLFISLSIVGLIATLHTWNIHPGLADAVYFLKQNWPWGSQEAVVGVVQVSKLFSVP